MTRNVLATAMAGAAMALGAIGAPTALTAQQQSPEFEWRGVVEAGRTLEVRGLNGHVHAVPAEGDQVRVRAERTARRSDPMSVRIEVVEHADGVTLCAVYPTPDGASRPNECVPGGGRNNVRDNDVQVDFTVEVPATVRFTGVTVNGRVTAERLRGYVSARTVNGNVRVWTDGLASAATVNGSITCRIGAASLSGPLDFETVNGSITLELPSELDAELDARAVSGRIESDFAIMQSGRISSRRLQGTIGDGGPELRVSTVNGSIRLRR